MNAQNLGVVFFPAFDWAISPSHPEREERLLYTRDQILEEGLLDMPAIREYKPKVASYRDVERVHVGVPDMDSLLTDAHLISAGGAIAAADAVMRKEVKRAFAMVRPPGHHAMRIVHGTRGFCTINMEAIMVEYIRKTYGIGKVAIIDTDVHHGDGTQDIFYHDPETLFISFHQDGRTLYPGTGFPHELGSPNAMGTTVNIPLPPGTGDQGLHEVLENFILPVLEDFKPELIINSAGQDNHYSDPLAGMAVTAQGYARLADALKADIAVLEGGYSIEAALPYVNVGIVLAMAGMDYSKVVEPDNSSCPSQSSSVTRCIRDRIQERQLMWKKREQLRREALEQHGRFWERKRSIYYDDDGIEEEQKERLYLCPHCSGYAMIETSAQSSFQRNTACVGIIPRVACPACRRSAYEAVHNAKKQGQYQQYLVQNKYEDRMEIL